MRTGNISVGVRVGFGAAAESRISGHGGFRFSCDVSELWFLADVGRRNGAQMDVSERNDIQMWKVSAPTVSQLEFAFAC